MQYCYPRKSLPYAGLSSNGLEIQKKRNENRDVNVKFVS